MISINNAGTIGSVYAKNPKNLVTYQKLTQNGSLHYSKCNKKTRKLQEENTGKNLCDLALG